MITYHACRASIAFTLNSRFTIAQIFSQLTDFSKHTINSTQPVKPPPSVAASRHFWMSSRGLAEGRHFWPSSRGPGVARGAGPPSQLHCVFNTPQLSRVAGAVRSICPGRIGPDLRVSGAGWTRKAGLPVPPLLDSPWASPLTLPADGEGVD